MEYKFSDKVSTLQPSAIRELFKLMGGKGIIALSGGNPAREAFPMEEIAEIASDILKSHPVDALQYSVSEGYLPLRELIASFAKEKYDINMEENEVLITSGAQQANDLVAKIFCNDGDTIICDDACFIGSLSSFRSNNVNITGVKMDDEGMIPEELEKVILATPSAKVIYLIPNFQNPTGLTMPLERRKAIFDVAKKHNLLIIEDDPYGQLRWKGEAVPPIKSFDTDGRVCYSGTFSKVVAPGLRVGYMIADRAIVDRGTLLKQFSDVHTNILAQIIVYEYFSRYDTDTNIKNIAKFYGDKAEYMCSLIREEFPDGMKCIEPEGGMFIWCTDTTGKLDVEKLVHRLVTEENVAIISGNVFMTNGNKSNSFRLNFTVPTMDQIEIGIKAIAKLIKEEYAL